MIFLKDKYLYHKEFVCFVLLNYADKFLVFILPLVILYFTNDRDCYNSIEYIYSIANVFLPFLLFISAYCFYEFKENKGEKSSYVIQYKEFSSLTFVIVLILGCVGICFISFIAAPIAEITAFLVLIRLVYLLYINYYTTFYRLIDKPSQILFFSIICSAVSLLLSVCFRSSSNSILLAFFVPQLILALSFAYPLFSISSGFTKRYVEYVKKSIGFSWPVIVNSTIVAFVMNYGKIYAYNYLSSYEMYNFSYVMRISMIIQMAHTSMIAYYGKELYLKGYSSSFYKKYISVIGIAFSLSIVILFSFNYFTSFDKLTIDITTYLILLYTLIHCCGASLELFFGRENMNRSILGVSVISCATFCGLIFICKVESLKTLAIYMVSYSLIYFILLAMNAYCKKLVGLIICIIPLNALRILLYRIFMGYDIDFKSKIGLFNLIVCKEVFIRQAYIGKFNIIKAERLQMMPDARIRSLNNIKLMNIVVLNEGAEINRRNAIIGACLLWNTKKEVCNFHMGERSLLTNQCSIDCTNSVEMGANVVLGGKQTQVWTHGFDVERHIVSKPIVMGSNIYIGSRVLICQGITIADNVVIGAGTCVSKSISESGFYVSNRLVRKGDVRQYK